MAESELRVEHTPRLYPACETGRHVAHPGETCEEWEEFAAVARGLYERAFAEVFAAWHAEVDRWLITGSGAGEPRGFLNREEREPTPVQRALAILDPHLRACPLYDAGPPVLYTRTDLR